MHLVNAMGSVGSKALRPPPYAPLLPGSLFFYSFPLALASQSGVTYRAPTQRNTQRSSSISTLAAPPAAEALVGDYYEEFGRIYKERWPQLYAAMAAPTRHVALRNAFIAQRLTAVQLPGIVPLEGFQPRLAALLASMGRHVAGQSSIEACGWEPPDGPDGDISYPPPAADPATGLSGWYWLDPASLLPPLLLDVRPGQTVLDMCAAPGGKSLVLAQLLFQAVRSPAIESRPAGSHQPAASDEQIHDVGSVGRRSSGGDRCADSSAAGSDQGRHQLGPASSRTTVTPSGGSVPTGSLVCNELEGRRRARLARVLRDYLPMGVRDSVSVTPHDGARYWGRNQADHFDRVLLDAPCSSDRHVAQQAAARGAPVSRADWSLARCRRLAETQEKLVLAGIKALKPGGRLVYSTCSVADMENDGVIERVLQRAQGSVAVISHTLHPPGSSNDQLRAGLDTAAKLDGWAAQTRHGWIMLPDVAGCGPIYVTVITKLASSELKRVKVNKYARS